MELYFGFWSAVSALYIGVFVYYARKILKALHAL
jgi:hypothetical protein